MYCLAVIVGLMTLYAALNLRRIRKGGGLPKETP